VFLSSPRSTAEVVLYVSSQEVALVDRVHLRFVGTISSAPPVVEIDVDLDSRADDDRLLAQLEPAFRRGISLYVAARHPDAVTIALVQPQSTAVARPATTPWGGSLSLNLGYPFLKSTGSLTLNHMNPLYIVGGTLGLRMSPPLSAGGPDGALLLGYDTTTLGINGSNNLYVKNPGPTYAADTVTLDTTGFAGSAS
jgi:hypothetical protein